MPYKDGSREMGMVDVLFIVDDGGSLHLASSPWASKDLDQIQSGPAVKVQGDMEGAAAIVVDKGGALRYIRLVAVGRNIDIKGGQELMCTREGRRAKKRDTFSV